VKTALQEAIGGAEARLSLAEKIIKDLNLEPLECPEPIARNFEKCLSQCAKCSRWVKDEMYSFHWASCPWRCGLCGQESNSEATAREHAWKCSMYRLDKETD
jgi:hypothetical protein